MSNTHRHNWFGKEIRDGEHGKKCPEPNCSYCGNGKSKNNLIRKLRRSNTKTIQKELE